MSRAVALSKWHALHARGAPGGDLSQDVYASGGCPTRDENTEWNACLAHILRWRGKRVERVVKLPRSGFGALEALYFR